MQNQESKDTIRPIELTDDQIREKLRKTRTIAVIGCSDKQYRTSYQIASYLQDQGFKIIPINPNVHETLGEKTFGSILDLIDRPEIDLVDIFRNKKFTHEMVEEIAKWSEATGQKPLVWTQLDVSSGKAKQIAIENRLPYVENRCLMVEHQRLIG